jgi:hypothetical protein
MKKVISDFVRSHGGTTTYSGNTKTMHINDKNNVGIEMKILEKFGYSLPFKLSTN